MMGEIANFLRTSSAVLLGNSRFMSWNLFLALVPLALAYWLFRQPRYSSATLRRPLMFWGVLLLLGATFWANARRVLVRAIYLLQGEAIIYILGAIAITLTLMALDFWLIRPRQQQRYRSPLWWMGVLVFIAFLPNAPYVLTDVIHLYEDIRQNYSVWVLTLAVIPQYFLFILFGFEAYVLSLIQMGDYLKLQGWQKSIWGVELIVHGLCAVGIYLGRFKRFNSWELVTNPDVVIGSVLNDLVARRPLLVMVVTMVAIAILYWLMKLITLAISQKLESDNRLRAAQQE